MKKSAVCVALLLSASNDYSMASADELTFGLDGNGDGQGPIQLFKKVEPQVDYHFNNGSGGAYDDDDFYEEDYSPSGFDWKDTYNDWQNTYNPEYDDDEIDLANDDYFNPKPSQKLPDPYKHQTAEKKKPEPHKQSSTDPTGINGNSNQPGSKINTPTSQGKTTKIESQSKIESNQSPEEMKHQSFDFVEKLMYRLTKDENRTEALIIGCCMMLFGIVFLFAGASSHQVIFGIICSITLTILLTIIGCLISDESWYSEAGVCITGISLMITAPIVQYSLKFSDKLAIPLMAGLSLAAIAQIGLNLAKLTDLPPYHYKTVTETSSLVLGFLITLKIKDQIAMFVTSFFGSFTCTIAGMIIINEMPLKDLKFRNGKVSLNRAQVVQLYIPMMISIFILTLIGYMYQREQDKDKLRISLQQQQLSKMVNSKPRMSYAQMERGKAKMAAAAKSNASEKNSTGASTKSPSSYNKAQKMNKSSALTSNTSQNDEEK